MQGYFLSILLPLKMDRVICTNCLCTGVTTKIIEYPSAFLLIQIETKFDFELPPSINEFLHLYCILRSSVERFSSILQWCRTFIHNVFHLDLISLHTRLKLKESLLSANEEFRFRLLRNSVLLGHLMALEELSCIKVSLID